MTFQLRTKEATVTYDPALVRAEEVRKAIDAANEAMATEGQPSPQQEILLAPPDTQGPGSTGRSP